jgi:hypothetical protein
MVEGPVYVLPYMNQLPQDYGRSKIVAPTPAPIPTPVPVVPVVPILFPPTSPAPEPPPQGSQIGGPIYGNTPPLNPGYGWLWINTANNGLYAYTDPGVWTQIGTNL